uniref:Monodehydroascorbate reductase n=1 Tax=Tanacetum cinerariifolium TaxID=118510 RepID=A0A6L2NQ55_TANCI|nr:monodehydroascorbate reductase [Tanacetum cinerariifolium]
MADVNAPSGQAPAMAPPVRTDDQIFPRIRWVSNGKSNCYLDLEKSQGNPIYKIAVDLLKNTNFFRAFTASSTIPSIYIPQFWDTVLYDKKAGSYMCQLDEQWFVLTKDTLREALQITPINNNQPFIAPPLTDTLINFVNELGYPKKTSGFERPRVPVLQILWGIVKQANIDYAKRIWEEFVQSIHTFIKNKQNLSRHTTGKKRATLIMIPSIRFTKLIIHHLQRRHKFYPRPDSPLYLPNEEPVLGYLKFSAKGTKREVFEMPIHGLITVDIHAASYYQEYLVSVAKYRRYLASETGSVQDSPAPKPTKPTRKPKSTAPKAPPRPAVSTPVTSAQPAPTSTPAKPQEKKRKQATETFDKPPKAKKSKYSSVGKKRSLKSVAASEAKDVPVMEPQVAAVDTDLQKALEESMKTAYALPKGPLPPVVIREPESRKYQPLPEVPGKGKAKVTEEQVAHDLLSLQKPKKKSHADQYIFQRRVSEPTGSSGHNESPYAVLGQSDSEEESEKVVLGADEGGQGEGQARPDPGAQAKGQTGSDADRDHMDLGFADVSPKPSTEQLDEEFTATAYPKVQENLKLAVEEHVLLEDPASSSGTLSSLQHLSRDISFGDLFFCDKPSNADKNAETKVESMVNVPIQQALSSISLMTSSIIDLTSRPESPKVSKAVSKVVTNAVDWAMQAPLRNRFRDLPEADMKEILHQHIWETESYKTHEDHMQLFKALEKSMNREHSEELAQDLAEARNKKKKSRESPKTPPGSPSHQPPPPPLPAGSSEALGAPGASGSSQVPPPPPLPSSTNQESPSKGSIAPSSSKTAASAKYQAWTTTDIRLRPSISLIPTDLEMDADIAPDEQAQSLDDEDIGTRFSRRPVISPHSWTGSARDEALLCSNLKTWKAPHLKSLKSFIITLEQMVPDQFWIEEECKYDIAVMYGISHWWFQRQRFYIDRHTSEGDRRAVSTHMRILSVVRIEVFSMYGYDYMKKIVLRRADLNEHVIAEQEFKFKYEVLDQEGRGSMQGIHVRYSEAFEDKEDLSQPGELCWWTRQRGRLQTFEAYRMIKSFWHFRPLSDDL